MRILVLSDSHGNYGRALKAHELAGAVDHVVHLGDGEEDARLLEDVLEIPVLRVAGNCDLGSRLPQERLVRFGNTPVLITHGNRYHVKGGLAHLARRGREAGAAVVLYGHTHLAQVDQDDEILLINPGALQGNRGSYAIVTIEAGRIEAELFSFD
ncbi:metallophosphoesterase family protein [Geomesophilobacter sediminis]|uniref:Phosphoesterase n=1 Tax=Geomesophilobacter sediminis TaxID=2798584 RepID=A0A8J7M2U9_9BACT|nr:metallophosphoesterase [Geomesophilobacter sediminis]MBJ6727618.1 metallophosphoesterase [Geomesophilobacter sediminis]